MIKQIKLKGDPITLKCSLIINSMFGGCSDTELTLFVWLLNFSTANSLTITPHIAAQLKQMTNLKDSSFSTSLFRLEKKKVFIRTGKNINFHPVFNNIHNTEKLLIEFEAEKVEVKIPEISNQ